MAATLPSRAGIAAAVARHYDELDAFYREIWGTHLHHGLWRTGRESRTEAVEALVAHVAESVQLGAGERVVDVGAGYGETARQLAERYDAQVTGVTITPAQHAYARQRPVDDRVRVLLQDWLDNTIPSRSADVVVAIESAEHMEDLHFALREMRRVLRPGGRVAICAWLAAEAPSEWQRRWLLDPIREEGRLVTLPAASQLLRLMSEAGLEGATVQDLTRKVAFTWTLSLRRLVARMLTDPRYVRYALRREHGERVFLAAMLRILAAYRVGAMRYGLFIARAPAA